MRKKECPNASECLAESAMRMICREDFEVWLGKMRDAESHEWAREKICEGLRALRISHKPYGDENYYRGLVENHVRKTKKISSRAEMEERLLRLLFEAWNSESGGKLRGELSLRSETPPMSAEEYRKEVYIYFRDDIGRFGGETRHPGKLWFSDGKGTVDRIAELFSDTSDFDREKAEGFVSAMRTLEGLYSEGDGGEEIFPAKITRTHLLWHSYDYTLSRAECFGSSHSVSFPDVMRAFYGDEQLNAAGYAPITARNCLDVYLMFSAYRALCKKRNG